MLNALTSVLALVVTASAHFTLLYPEPRGNSFRAPASQWIYPCAGLNTTDSSPRTLWPLNGGAVSYNNSHDHVYAFFNLALGGSPGISAVTFNVSLVEENPLSVTGGGVFCLPNLKPYGINVTEGTNASIQVITLAHSGAALYNCADITFSATAPTANSSVCSNSTGITAAQIQDVNSTSSGHSSHGTNTSSAANSTSTAKSAAPYGHGSSAISTVVVGVAAVVMSYFL